MDRISGAGHVNNRFVSEDVATSRPPTEITPEWMNGVQEELVAIIEASGQTPSKSIWNQLLLALRLEGVFSTPAANDRSTKAATTAWLYAAMETVMTFFGFACSLGANGYLRLPSILGGAMGQWGTVLASTTAANVGASWSATLPTAFPSQISSAYGHVANCPTNYLNVSVLDGVAMPSTANLGSVTGAICAGSVVSGVKVRYLLIGK